MHRFPAALLAAAALAAGFSPALAKETVPVDRPLPVDDRYDVRETLPSGLKLYVRHHEVPKGMVAMWLHFGTGSVNETDAERGLAHFLEHMAFRGSTHFKPGTVTSRFEDLGVRFGRDQNAMTSFDQTTYQIALPRTDPHAISEALLFLSDVAHRLALLDPEIDDERGVVLEEARARAGAQMRILEQLFPLVAPGSLIAERLPIGIPEVVQKIDSKAMKAYWSKWYRPETSTLMIVGDIDAPTVAAMAKLAFADWRPAGDVPTPQDGGLLSQGARRAAVLTDPEVTQADLTWMRAEPLEASTTYGDFRDWCVDRLGTWIVGQRLDELRRTGNAPFQDAAFRTQPFVSGAQIRTLDVQSPPERWREAAQALLVDLLTGDRLHQRRAAEGQRALASHHGHEVREPRDVGGARRARADHGRHLRYHAAHQHLLAKQVSAGSEGADHVGMMTAPGVDARARGVDEPHHGPASTEGHGPEARHLLFAGLPDAAALHREVVGGDAHHAAIHLAEGAHHAVCRSVVALSRSAHLPAVKTDLEELAVVEQQVETLAGRELSPLVLARDLVGATHLAHPLAACLELRHALPHAHCQCPVQRGARFSRNADSPSRASSVPRHSPNR